MELNTSEFTLNGIEVRPAQPSDIDAIAAIYLHYVRESVMTFELAPGPSRDELASRMRHVKELHGLPYLVAVSPGTDDKDNNNGRVIGYGYVGVHRPRPAYDHTGELSLFLDHRHTGRGVGTALLKHLVQSLRDAGRIRQLIAVMAVDDDEAASAEPFYLGNGFRKVGLLEKVGYKFDKWIDGKDIIHRASPQRITHSYNEEHEQWPIFK
jgi:L-amino acid N-acyltransferase YncA